MLGRARDVLRAYRAAYENWPWVLLNLALRGRARAATRDGRVVEGDDVILGAIARLYALGLGDRAVQSFWRVWDTQRGEAAAEGASPVVSALLASGKLYALRYELRCCRLADVSEDLSYIVVDVGGRRAVIYGWSGAPLADYDDYFNVLDVRNKSVLDVGAYVGDSAILFVLRGARRVVAVEPSPWAYNVAKKNVEANGLGDVITLVNCAVAREDGKVLMLPAAETSSGFRAVIAAGGQVPVPTCTLDSLIERYGPFDVVKMDCEGCEHESIPYSRRIGEVKEILVEYHGGVYETIVTRLKSEFKTVKFAKPLEGGKLYDRPVVAKIGDLVVGLVYASK